MNFGSLEINTYKELQVYNNRAKSGKNHELVQIVDVLISPNGPGMDMITCSNGRSYRIYGFLSNIVTGAYVLTNPSKLAQWRGFIKK